MAFPNDLTDVAVFKIHPAIGVARLSNNDDFYEFFEYEKIRNEGNAQTLTYMSEQNGKHLVKRQAVQYKIFAYKADGQEAGELTSDVMGQLGLTAKWTAKVANRKLNNFSNGATPVVQGEATAAAGETKRIEGNNPWRATQVWLGDISGEGLFVPPKGGVYRKDANKTIPPYGQHQSDNGVLDTTSDGAISAELSGTAIPIIPACVIVAPQQHSPDVNPDDVDDARNKDFVKETRRLLGIPQNSTLNGVGYEMDLAIMKTINAEYNPGMELCLNSGSALPIPSKAFYERGANHIDASEIRPKYEAGQANHGALTAGLCSAWQTDLNACLNYWTAEFPNTLNFDTSPNERKLARKQYAQAGPQMGNPEDLNVSIDMMDIGRNTDDDIFSLKGTERTSSDNVGATPTAPFPLDPS